MTTTKTTARPQRIAPRRAAAAPPINEIERARAARFDRAAAYDRAAENLRAEIAAAKTAPPAISAAAAMETAPAAIPAEIAAALIERAHIAAFCTCKAISNSLKMPAALIERRDRARRNVAEYRAAVENLPAVIETETKTARDRDEIAADYSAHMSAARAAKTAATREKHERAAAAILPALRAAQNAAQNAAAAADKIRAALFAEIGAEMIDAAAAALIECYRAAPPADKTAETLEKWADTPAAAIGEKSPQKCAISAARAVLRGYDTRDEITEISDDMPAAMPARVGIWGLIDEISAAAGLTPALTETLETLYCAQSLRAAAPLLDISAPALLKRRNKIRAAIAAAADDMPAEIAPAIAAAAADDMPAAAALLIDAAAILPDTAAPDTAPAEIAAALIPLVFSRRFAVKDTAAQDTAAAAIPAEIAARADTARAADFSAAAQDTARAARAAAMHARAADLYASAAAAMETARAAYRAAIAARAAQDTAAENAARAAYRAAISAAAINTAAAQDTARAAAEIG